VDHPRALLPPFNGAVSSIKKGGEGGQKGGVNDLFEFW